MSDLINVSSEIQDIDTKDQIKLFLLNQAKRELERIKSLTETLDKLQEKYQEKVMEYMEDPNNEQSLVVVLPQFMNVITGCLERSQNIIREIVNDKTLNNINFNLLTQINKTANLSVQIENPSSRQKIREVISAIIAELDKVNKAQE